VEKILAEVYEFADLVARKIDPPWKQFAAGSDDSEVRVYTDRYDEPIAYLIVDRERRRVEDIGILEQNRKTLWLLRTLRRDLLEMILANPKLWWSATVREDSMHLLETAKRRQIIELKIVGKTNKSEPKTLVQFRCSQCSDLVGD